MATSSRAGESRLRSQARFEARLPAATKELIERAAGLGGRSLSDFVISSATEAAMATIERYEKLILVDNADREMCARLLLNPPKPNKALRDAAKRHRQRS